MLKLEPRPQPPRSFWSYGSPLLALAITVLIGVALFMALGKDPVRACRCFSGSRSRAAMPWAN
jgi:ABC-type uncharacterized transport system permease subunit